jgi:hypothetical protein
MQTQGPQKKKEYYAPDFDGKRRDHEPRNAGRL